MNRPFAPGGAATFTLGLMLLLAASLLAGCKSKGISRYIAPAVTGRVLDAESAGPVGSVVVRRNNPDDRTHTMEPPKGAELLRGHPTAISGEDGTFMLESIRNLSPFGHMDWYSVSLTFEHPGYVRFSTNYTLGSVTNSAEGEPVLPTGDILLRRRTN